MALSGGGTFRGDRRLCRRGTQEFATAEAEGLLDRISPPPPRAIPAAIEVAETLIGTGLPKLLKELCTIANEGFGPGYGLLGLRDGFIDDRHRTAVDILAEVPQGLWPGMPAGLLPLCHWGCATAPSSTVPRDGSAAGTPTPVGPDDDVPFFAQEYVLDTWIETWLNGSLQQPG